LQLVVTGIIAISNTVLEITKYSSTVSDTEKDLLQISSAINNNYSIAVLTTVRNATHSVPV